MINSRHQLTNGPRAAANRSVSKVSCEYKLELEILNIK